LLVKNIYFFFKSLLLSSFFTSDSFQLIGFNLLKKDAYCARFIASTQKRIVNFTPPREVKIIVTCEKTKNDK